MRIAGLLIVVLMLNACTTVKPWERGTLAREEMQFGFDPLNNAYDDHVYFSKEASSGGRGFGGGGCGCN